MEWIRVEDSLPGIGEGAYDKIGYPNGLFALWREKPDCGHRATVTSLEYFIRHPDEFTHWMPIPKLPDVVETELTQDEIIFLKKLANIYRG